MSGSGLRKIEYEPHDLKENPSGDILLDPSDSARVLERTDPQKTPDELFDELKSIYLSYRPDDDLKILKKAYKFASDRHKKQLRKSGEPYITHPLNTAIILAELGLDLDTLCAALLHDVVEDTGTSLEDVRSNFGDHVVLLVDGVTKLTNLSLDVGKIEFQAENLRKMFIAMAKDIRVVLIKLADRLHNLRTLQYQSREKQIEKATESLEIYSPIADRLGISKLRIELDDISLKYLKPEVYKELVEKVSQIKTEREAFIEEIKNEISEKLKVSGIKAELTGRVKHYFSIYKKMIKQGVDLDQIYDLFALRVIVDTVKDCYGALGVIHEMYKPIPGRFKDYIAMPKPNHYQSLHTTLIGRDGTPFEIQIRTYEMHKVSEYGIAAHWKYKESGGSTEKADSISDEKMSWLRQLLEWQQDAGDSKDFIDMVKSDLNRFNDDVYCFTPTGDVKNLPLGSTPIDFAYAIHSAVGNKMVGARVNGKLVPIDYVLQNGDRVDIITSQNSRGPSRDWLSIIKSTQARSKINQWFKSQNKEENIVRGKDLLDKYLKAKGINQSDILKPEFTEAVLKRYAMQDWNTVLATLGHGGLKENQVVGKLLDTKKKYDLEHITDEAVLAAHDVKIEEVANHLEAKPLKGGILVKGVNDLSARCARCCNPVPGDEIVGFVTRGRGVTIHRTDCINMINLPTSERNRLIEAEWDVVGGSGEDSYSAEVKIYCSNRVGMLADISRVFTDLSININAVNVRTAKNGTATNTINFNIRGKNELNKLVDKLRMIPDVYDITRATG